MCYNIKKGDFMSEVSDKKKTSFFEKELEYINNERYKKSAMTLIELLPDYFFSVPASSTGKYHPSFSLGDGGLLRHTKAAVRMANELFGIYKFPDRIKDLIILFTISELNSNKKDLIIIHGNEISNNNLTK